MAQVSASSSIQLAAAPEVVLTALADYETVRPRILTEHYRDYRVISGGRGDGTVVHWILQATEKRQRDVHATVSVKGSTVTETDANSTLVTTYSVVPNGTGSTVVVLTQWKGAGGVKGFFEKTFAPLGLKKIQQQVLENLKKEVD
ncbi:MULTISPECIES: SRPBCC family protein [Rhodococcus]|uniref:SRPBCC family protein n=1 Tax=Rhodococcus sp. 852002-51564_SCH6189132-a TaxID=1834103 RepID=UPI0007EAF688|nr:SRPBCC family protein [Rhodococcus sp. 852002-51564_SCH6189132-a]OBA39865.1 polyketide cyclase [Rhodococcus sp. 852002-51564_SCH6189132-a]